MSDIIDALLDPADTDPWVLCERGAYEIQRLRGLLGRWLSWAEHRDLTPDQFNELVWASQAAEDGEPAVQPDDAKAQLRADAERWFPSLRAAPQPDARRCESCGAAMQPDGFVGTLLVCSAGCIDSRGAAPQPSACSHDSGDVVLADGKWTGTCRVCHQVVFERTADPTSDGQD